MRLALMVDPPAGASALTELEAAPLARVVLIPQAARAAHALVIAMRAYGAAGDDVVVVRKVGDGFVPSVDWDEAAARRATVADDEATLDARTVEASRALAEARLDEAEEAYEQCALLLAGELGPRHAEVLYSLARIAETRQNDRVAAEYADHALAVFPAHRGAAALRQRTAERTGENVVAAAMAQRQLAHALDDAERVSLLNRTAELGLRAAIDAMQAAWKIRPGDATLLDRLRTVLEATRDWKGAVDVAVAAAEQLEDPRERARAFVAAADKSASLARNVGRAVALYEAAIADDPEVPGAFEAIEKVLLDAGDYAGAERAYERQLERLSGRGPAEAAVLEKLARVREERLGDRRGAIQALDRLITVRPDDIDALAKLARLLEDNGEDGLALKVLEILAQHAPTRVETFRALARVHARNGDADRAFCAASVLVHLGEAGPGEQRTYQESAPTVGLRPTHPLQDAGWSQLLPRELTGGALALFSAIGPAAIDLRVEQLRSKKALPSLDPGERQDTERTTVSAVRTAGWVAKLLGFPVPDVYVWKRDVPGGLAILPVREAALALGPSILSGRSVTELAFLFARELTQMRLTGRLLVFYPDIADLRRLVTAGISIAIGHTGQIPSEIEPIRRDLTRRLDTASQTRLAAAVQTIGERGGQLDLVVWLRAVERAACRAGLLACGDLSIAARVLSVDERVAGGLSAAERLRDLVPFSVSPAYAEVRRAIGVAVTGRGG